MTAEQGFSPSEVMTVAAARMLANGLVCFVGIGLPSKAANLARLTHAPEVVLIYESGPIGAKPDVLPLSIGDGVLSTTAQTVVSTPEIFQYWLQGGRVDVGFLGAAQIDRFANINTTVIGPYEKPKVRLLALAARPKSPAWRARWSSSSSRSGGPSWRSSSSSLPRAFSTAGTRGGARACSARDPPR